MIKLKNLSKTENEIFKEYELLEKKLTEIQEIESTKNKKNAILSYKTRLENLYVKCEQEESEAIKIGVCERLKEMQLTVDNLMPKDRLQKIVDNINKVKEIFSDKKPKLNNKL